MDIQVRGEHIEVTDALREYSSQKIGNLEKHLKVPLDRPANVLLFREGKQHRVEVAFQVRGVLFRAEERTDDMYTSIDLVADKLERQIDKHRTRLSKRLHQGDKDALKMSSYEGNAESEDSVLPLANRIARVKKFPAKPMSIEEAILQMDLVNHDFFVFTNADTQEVNVLYRRKQGDVGLLEPQ